MLLCQETWFFWEVTVPLLTGTKKKKVEPGLGKGNSIPVFILEGDHMLVAISMRRVGLICMMSSFYFSFISKKVHKIQMAQADLMKDHKSTLLLLCSSSARGFTCRDQGFSIRYIAQTAGNSAGCKEPRNTKDSFISYTSFINFN